MAAKYNSTDLICINPQVLLDDPQMQNADTKTWGAYFLFYMHLWRNGGVIHKNISQFMHIFKVRHWSTAKELYEKIAHLFAESDELVYANFVIKNTDDLTKFRERQRRNSYVGRQKQGISPKGEKESGGVLPITTTTTTLNHNHNGIEENLLAIIMKWNEVSQKPIPIRGGEVCKSLLEAATGLVRKLKLKTILDSIENFGQARSIKHTQAFNWNLTNFLLKGYKKYLPGIFDPDHFDASQFSKENRNQKSSPEGGKIHEHY